MKSFNRRGVHQTRLSVVSDRELCQQVVRIYRRLGERREKMQQLRITIAQNQQSSYDSSTVENFLDFISRFSVNGPNSSIDKLLGAISGHPNYLLETSPTFYPEQYDTAFPDKMMSVSAILPLPSHRRTQRYFITFQEKARIWRRVIVVATFENFRDPSAMIQVSAVAYRRLTDQWIPELLKTPLQKLLREMENFSCVTNVSVNLKETETGQIAANTTRVEEVENLFEDFIGEVKRLASLNGCRGIVQFLGVILDDTRHHIKGYLYDAPIIPNLRLLIGLAISQSKSIPWAVRELWIGQIVATISNVHARGLVIGALNINRISIRADATVLLDLSECAHRQLPTQRDRLPPELWRMNFDTCRVSRNAPLNFQTDVFQLGHLIWLIAEHQPSSQGYYCTRVLCTNVPCYQCTASHTEPTELPACSVGVPLYINDLVTASRLPNPQDRPSASLLLTLFPPIDVESQKSVQDEFMKDTIRDYPSSSDGTWVWCDECGFMMTDVGYHCYICNSGDFDLCPSCYIEEIHCWNLQHHMVKSIRKGEILNAID